MLAKLGMFMNIAPPGDQLVLDLSGALADFLFKIGHDRLRRRSVRPARGQDRRENCGAKRAAHVSLHQPTAIKTLVATPLSIMAIGAFWLLWTIITLYL
jgi:hypothetical protein